ncbi:hypothetical protein L1987_86959 [Smallanthus sonchifolius]|uniref:Uncharacterized protein n=1 Tax=Smallanthus sonchifolius TaxID=185202 RepID=A0ACB8Y010_9ASTR|nr:hypothetical protein L1987_86959 [Smallanthus sonchifolius]
MIIFFVKCVRPGQIAQAVYDVEEATSIAFDIILEHKFIKPDTKATLIKLMQLMVSHHPSRRFNKMEVVGVFWCQNRSRTVTSFCFEHSSKFGLNIQIKESGIIGRSIYLS